MKSKILLSGGGTGGHIYPALAIADEICKKNPDVEILFAGTKEGLEKNIVPQAGYSIEYIRSAGIERRFTLENVKNFSLAIAGLWDAKKLLDEFKPDVVIGTGGYVCGPILLMAGLKKIPILLQEQNAILGITNRIVQRFAQKIALGDAGASQVLKGDLQRIKVTGNPVRPDFFQIGRQEARRKLGISEDEKLLVITGGSRGARSLNMNSLGIHRWVKETPNLRLIHGTGTTQWESFCEFLQNNSLEITDSKREVCPYLKNMPEILRSADFIISRAGALALAEIAVCEIPSLLVPYPFAAEDHQTANAKSFVEVDAAVTVADCDLTEERMRRAVMEIFEGTEKLSQMRENVKKIAKPNATAEIADMALSLLERVES